MLGCFCASKKRKIHPLEFRLNLTFKETRLFPSHKEGLVTEIRSSPSSTLPGPPSISGKLCEKEELLKRGDGVPRGAQVGDQGA